MKQISFLIMTALTVALVLATEVLATEALETEVLETTPKTSTKKNMDSQPEARAIFAGGCFWCMEEAFEALDGVDQAVSGYIGGNIANPAYAQVSKGSTGHTEAIEVLYDPEKISYDDLLTAFWHNIDPLDAKGQFCDKGSQYRSGIFYLDNNQKNLALASKQILTESKILGSAIQTEITKASTFYPAEDYHQDYYLKNPRRYQFYKWNCGRKQRLYQLWGTKEK